MVPFIDSKCACYLMLYFPWINFYYLFEITNIEIGKRLDFSAQHFDESNFLKYNPISCPYPFPSSILLDKNC